MLPYWVSLVFPPNDRLDWKVIASYKHSSFFGLIDSDKGKKFYNIDTMCFNKQQVSLFAQKLRLPQMGMP
jgi:hypothetical protein